MLTTVIDFLRRYCSSCKPVLLALSGGADSLSLFHCLLEAQKRCLVSFHVAHVDHGWRVESMEEAQALKMLVEGQRIPYHEKRLDPSLLGGNLEAAFRGARQQFFYELCQQYGFQGVMLAHQQNDQVETVLKRVLEGAHWSHFQGLQEETWLQGVRYLRPLLPVGKKEIYQFLEDNLLIPFEDPTNTDERFMRARMRQTIIPQLNQMFGKQIENNLLYLSQEMQELKEFLQQKVSVYLDCILRGRFGSYVNLQQVSHLSFIEIKYLLRLVCEKEAFPLSRSILQRMGEAFLRNESNIFFEKGGKRALIDHQYLFILPSLQDPIWTDSLPLTQNGLSWANKTWKIEVKKSLFSLQSPASWKDAWTGLTSACLPMGDYCLAPPACKACRTAHAIPLDRWWAKHKVPSFLRPYFPVIWQGDVIFHEFLTGQMDPSLKQGEECLEIVLSLQ